MPRGTTHQPGRHRNRSCSREARETSHAIEKNSAKRMSSIPDTLRRPPTLPDKRAPSRHGGPRTPPPEPPSSSRWVVASGSRAEARAPQAVRERRAAWVSAAWPSRSSPSGRTQSTITLAASALHRSSAPAAPSPWRSSCELAQAAGGDVAVGLDPARSARRPSPSAPVSTMWRTRDVRVEQHRARVAARGVGDVALDRALRLRTRVEPERLEHVHRVDAAVIERQHGEPAVGDDRLPDSVVQSSSRSTSGETLLQLDNDVNAFLGTLLQVDPAPCRTGGAEGRAAWCAGATMRDVAEPPPSVSLKTVSRVVNERARGVEPRTTAARVDAAIASPRAHRRNDAAPAACATASPGPPSASSSRTSRTRSTPPSPGPSSRWPSAHDRGHRAAGRLRRGGSRARARSSS